LMGDECRRTQRGNNNAYCQDNAISWFDWRRAHKHRDLLRFTQALIHFRRREPGVRQTDFLRGPPRRPGGLPDASWYGADGRPVNWQLDQRSLQCLLAAVAQRGTTAQPNHHVLMMFHAGVEPRRFFLPEIARGLAWWQFVNTGAASPRDIYPNLDGPAPPASGEIELKDERNILPAVCFYFLLIRKWRATSPPCPTFLSFQSGKLLFIGRLDATDTNGTVRLSQACAPMLAD